MASPKELINVTVIAPVGIRRAWMNGGNQLQLQVLILVDSSTITVTETGPFELDLFSLYTCTNVGNQPAPCRGLSGPSGPKCRKNLENVSGPGTPKSLHKVSGTVCMGSLRRVSGKCRKSLFGLFPRLNLFWGSGAGGPRRHFRDFFWHFGPEGPERHL